MYVGILKKAIELAESSTSRYRVGAVIFKGSRILGVGNNELRFCSRIPAQYKNYNQSLHAEQAAILDTPRNSLKGSSILVVRITKRGELKMAKPCKMCSTFIDYVEIKNIFYSNWEGEISKAK